MTTMNRERPSQKRQSLRTGTCASIVLLAFALTGGARAQTQGIEGDRFSFRGFGTIAATTHDADGLIYRRNVGQSRGVEAGDWEGYTDSLAGIQLNANLGAKLAMTTQAVTRMDVEGDWKPHVTQAFLRYSPDDALVLRGGRFGYDIYLLAESRQVGYSYLAVRPSQDFYGLVTNDEVDGVDASWTARVGPGLLKARAFGGRGSDQTAFADGTTWQGRSDVLGATLDYSYRALTARAAMLQVTYETGADLRTLGGLLLFTGAPEAVRVGAALDTASQISSGLQLGVAYDNGPLQAQALYGHIISDSIAGPNVDAYLAQVGYRFGGWTPYLAFATSRDRGARRSTGLPALPETQPLIDAVRTVQDNLRATQHSTSFGIRRDLSSRWDFKLQADFVSVEDSVLSLDHRPAGSGDVNMIVMTVAVDFVF